MQKFTATVLTHTPVPLPSWEHSFVLRLWPPAWFLPIMPKKMLKRSVWIHLNIRWTSAFVNLALCKIKFFFETFFLELFFRLEKIKTSSTKISLKFFFDSITLALVFRKILLTVKKKIVFKNSTFYANTKWLGHDNRRFEKKHFNDVPTIFW